MKMANMDSAFDFMFTSPKDDKGVSFILNLVFDTSIGAEVDGGGGGEQLQSLSTVAVNPNLRRVVQYCQLHSSHIPLLSTGKPEV